MFAEVITKHGKYRVASIPKKYTKKQIRQLEAIKESQKALNCRVKAKMQYEGFTLKYANDTY